MTETVIQRHRWTREEFERMVAAGVFHPEARLELIEGEIVNMVPQGSRHATSVQLTEQALRNIFTPGYAIRIQMPLALDGYSEPEPDIAVVEGTARDYRETHPSRAVLIVEVSDATLPFDSDQKKRLYARSGIPEYWILNLPDECLDVHRQPYKEDYQEILTYQKKELVTPLNSERQISVADLLPYE